MTLSHVVLVGAQSLFDKLKEMTIYHFRCSRIQYGGFNQFANIFSNHQESIHKVTEVLAIRQGQFDINRSEVVVTN